MEEPAEEISDQEGYQRTPRSGWSCPRALKGHKPESVELFAVVSSRSVKPTVAPRDRTVAKVEVQGPVGHKPDLWTGKG